MITAMFNPPDMKPVTVWAGLYGGHYDIIVFFKKKPTHKHQPGDHAVTEKGHEYVDVYAEYKAKNLFADMGMGTFEMWFPGVDLTPYTQKNGRPKDTEVRFGDLFEITLVVPLDEDGNIADFNPHEDYP